MSAPRLFKFPVLLYAANGSLVAPFVLAPLLCVVAGATTSDTVAANWSVIACSFCGASAILGAASLFGIWRHGWKRILPPAVTGILLNLGLGYLCLLLGAQNNLA